MNHDKPYIVGIVPDTRYSDIAVWDRHEGSITLPGCMSFFRLFDYLRDNAPKIAIVRIKSAETNNEIGRKIVEMCIYLELNYETVKQLGKADAQHFAMLAGYKNK